MEYGCFENTEVKDPVLPEECWNEKHRGESRAWLTKNIFSPNQGKPYKSTMKATYPYPFHEERKDVGERRGRTMQRMFEEAAEEIIAEMNKPPPVEKYCTEYDGNFGNIPIKHEENFEKKFLEYPLYTSAAMSFWNYKIERNQLSNVHFPGLTKSDDLKNPFRRHSKFTTPVTVALDDLEG